MARGDVAGLKRMTDVPFTMTGNETFRTREQLDQTLQTVAREMGKQKVAITAAGVVGLDEYAQTAPAKEKDYLASLRRPEVRVMYVRIQFDGHSDGGAIF